MSEQANTTVQKPDNEERWARDVLSKLAFATLIEQRRARRWGIFFKSLFILYLLLLLVLIFPSDWGAETMLSKRHTALVNVNGLISSSTQASASNFIAGLRKAFKNENVAGIILGINSPGGTPVQAGEMHDEIVRLREAHPDIPVYAVAADVCASGGYYVAAAAQEIYANRASIIGSIGVRGDGFGFVDTLEKLGIERRSYTSGDSKAFLDPFQPSKPEDVQHFQGMLDAVHQQFITAVRKGRGERLRDNPELFSGLIWTGEQSVELGLVDGLASTRYVAEELIGAETVVDYTQRPRLFERLFDRLGSTLGRVLARVLGLERVSPLR